jgi:diguanylate cyclase (GGDEF)-like protein/PAS domain S-box-containing protein
MFNIDTRHVVIAGFSLALVLMAGLTVIGLRQMAEINMQFEAITQEHVVKSTLIAKMRTTARERVLLLLAMALTSDPFERDEQFMRFNYGASDFLDMRGQLTRMKLSRDEQAILDRQRAMTMISVPIQERAAEMIMDGKASEAKELLIREAFPAQERVFEELAKLYELQNQNTANASAEAEKAYDTAYLLLIALGALAVLSGILITIFVTRTVTRAKNALFREKELAEVTLHSIGDAVMTTDAAGHLEYMNPVAENLTGWRTHEARGLPLNKVLNLLNEATRKPIDYFSQGASVDTALTGFSAPTLLQGRHGREYVIESSSAPILDRDGKTIGSVLVFHDVTQSQLLAQELSWQASHDSLTGLINRHEFERRMRELLESTRNEAKEHALLYIDLDQFKIVNDTCGHVAGDELLRQLAGLFHKKVRDTDILARLGGDEFGVLLESCPMEHALRIAEGLRESAQDFRFLWMDKVFEVGVSIGLTAINAHHASPESVLVAADAACYAAKNKGRNRVHVYQPDDIELAQRHGEMQWVSRITKALEQGRIVLYQQPISPIDGQAKDAEHYEVLLRLIDEAGEIITPSAFIPAAERYGIMTNIDRWVIRTLFSVKGMEWRERWNERTARGADHELLYSINLSGASISDDDFLDFLREQIRLYQVPPQILCFEITETAAITNLHKAVHFMQDLKDLGCRFALDDFGSGMSSFAYLKNLPVDFLKIDGAFIVDMLHDPVDLALVDAINRVAHILGMRTIAESVESDAIMDKLKNLRVDYVQGYAVGKPESLVVPLPAHHAGQRAVGEERS